MAPFKQVDDCGHVQEPERHLKICETSKGPRTHTLVILLLIEVKDGEEKANETVEKGERDQDHNHNVCLVDHLWEAQEVPRCNKYDRHKTD